MYQNGLDYLTVVFNLGRGWKTFWNILVTVVGSSVPQAFELSLKAYGLHTGPLNLLKWVGQRHVSAYLSTSKHNLRNISAHLFGL